MPGFRLDSELSLSMRITDFIHPSFAKIDAAIQKSNKRPIVGQRAGRK
jgi:hypothetical protein